MENLLGGILHLKTEFIATHVLIFALSGSYMTGEFHVDRQLGCHRWHRGNLVEKIDDRAQRRHGDHAVRKFWDVRRDRRQRLELDAAQTENDKQLPKKKYHQNITL